MAKSPYKPQAGHFYIIEFTAPFHHARHYSGGTTRPVLERVAEHASGNGANICRHAILAGVGFGRVLVVDVPNVFEFERWAKSQKSNPRMWQRLLATNPTARIVELGGAS